MTSELRITDDDSGEILTEKEHFEVQVFDGNRCWMGTYHFQLIDQIAQYLMTRVNMETSEVNIKRMNAKRNR